MKHYYKQFPEDFDTYDEFLMADFRSQSYNDDFRESDDFKEYEKNVEMEPKEAEKY